MSGENQSMTTDEADPPIFVTGQAFVRTYSHPSYADPWDVVEDHQKVLDFTASHPDAGSTQIANRLELPRGRIRPWLDGAQPDCVRGLQVAEEMGWINAGSDSDTFHGLNVFVAWIFSGGSIVRESWAPYFTVRDGQDRQILAEAAKLVGVELDVTRAADGRRAQEVRPIEHGSVLGRVLTVLGAPRGEKNVRHNLTLPAYLGDSPKEIGRRFVKIYIHNRGQHREDTDLVKFREHRTQAYLESLAGLIRRLTGESVTVSERNIHISASAAREISQWQPLLETP